jgi:hypothetical protein
VFEAIEELGAKMLAYSTEREPDRLRRAETGALSSAEVQVITSSVIRKSTKAGRSTW